jgi:hypothetical protein
MASDISNDGSAAANEGDRNDKCNVAIGHSWNKWMIVSFWLPCFFSETESVKSSSEYFFLYSF